MLPNANSTEAQLANGSTPAQDVSKTIMDNLFGTGWENYFSGAMGSGPFTLFFEMLKHINTVAFAITTFLIVFIALTGVAGTAHEGVSLGRRYSTLWTPIRSVMAIASLIPIPVIGISALQGVILLAVSHGIAGANILWGKSLDYMKNSPSTLVSMEMDIGASSEAENLVDSIIKATTTQAYLSQMNSNGSSVDSSSKLDVQWSPDIFSYGYLKSIANPDRMPKNGEGGTYYVEYKVSPSMSSLKGELGGISIPCDKQDSTCSRKKNAVVTFINDVYPAGKAIVEGKKANRNTLNAAQNKYKKEIARINNTRIKQEKTGFTAAINDFTSKAKQGGWVFAGAWYWTITSIQERTRDFISEHRIRAASIDTESVSETVYTDYDAVMNAARSYTGFSLDDAKTAAKLEKSIEDENWFLRSYHKVSGTIRDGFLFLAENMTALLTEGDPIQNLKFVGDSIIVIGEGAVTSYLGYKLWDSVKPQNALATNLNLLNDAKNNKSNNDAFSGLLVFAMLMPIFTLGLLLSFYLPTLPFYLWMSSVITWILLVVEAILAAPIIALGIAIPEGEGFIGPHSRRAVFLIANIVFRPMIMITVFFFIFYALKIVVWFIGMGYILFYNGLQATAFTGPLTVFMTVFMIGVFLIFVVERLFSLINTVPTAIFNWIEGGSSHLADNGNVYGKTSAMAGAGIAGTGKIAGEGLGAGGRHRSKSKQKGTGSSGSRTTDNDLSPGNLG